MHILHKYKGVMQTHKNAFWGEVPAMRIKEMCEKCGKVRYTRLQIDMDQIFLESDDKDWYGDLVIDMTHIIIHDKLKELMHGIK